VKRHVMHYRVKSPASPKPSNDMLEAVSRALLHSRSRAHIRFRIQSCFSTMTAAANSQTVDTSERLLKLRELMKLQSNSVNAVVIPSEDQRKWDPIFLPMGVSLTCEYLINRFKRISCPL
jgi:hypothetical protein